MQQVNLASEIIAFCVDKKINEKYYSVMLNSLQHEARQLGFYFANAKKGIPFSFLTIAPSPTESSPAWQMAYAVTLRRVCYIYPYATSSINEQRALIDMADGYGDLLLRDMLHALKTMGIRLQATSATVPTSLAKTETESITKRFLTNIVEPNFGIWALLFSTIGAVIIVAMIVFLAKVNEMIHL